MERLRQMEEDEDGYEGRIVRGRTRLNAHPADVVRDIENNKKSEKQLLLNSASKDESSIAYKKTALASGEFTVDQSLDNVENLNHDLNLSQDPLAKTDGGVTLPSIFHNKKFEKDLTQLELNYNEKDFLKSNANILDLKKLKKRNLNIFNQRSNSYHFNNSYSSGFGKLSKSKVMRGPTTPGAAKNATILKSNRKNLLNKTLRSNRGRKRTTKVSKAAVLNQSMMERQRRRVREKGISMRKEKSFMV